MSEDETAMSQIQSVERRLELDEFKLYRQHYGITLVRRCRKAIDNSNQQAQEHGHNGCSTPLGEILAAYRGRCDVCLRRESPLSQRNLLHMDHCHTTGLFRGWICHKCNVMVGMAGDDPALLEHAADWLRRLRREQLP